MNKTLNDAGKDGFHWFFGIVENRIDPLEMNRVQVRIFGAHSEKKTDMPTENLPWARCTLPLTNTATAHSLVEGDLVFGFFLDGNQMQEPMILANVVSNIGGKSSLVNGFTDPRTDFSNFPKIPLDVDKNFNIQDELQKNTSIGEKQSQLSKNTSGSRFADSIINKMRNITIDFKSFGGNIKKFIQNIPAPRYPFNNIVYQSESGHIIEADDTPGSERINFQHRTGMYIEIDNNGNTTILTKNGKIVCLNDHELMVKGDYNINIEGKYNHCNSSSYNLEINDGDMTIDVKSGNLNLTVNGNVTETISGNKTINTSTLNVNGNLNVTGQTSLKNTSILGSGTKNGREILTV